MNPAKEVMEDVEVYWGGEWITPHDFTRLDERTVCALVQTRLGSMAGVKFKNSRGRTAWRDKNRGDVLSQHGPQSPLSASSADTVQPMGSLVNSEVK